MATTTEFDAWLDANDPETAVDKEDLINSVQNAQTVGDHSTTRKGDRFFVKGLADDTLLLASEKARSAFIAQARRIKVPDDLEEGYQRNMNNPNA
jgi:hypothetical protein